MDEEIYSSVIARYLILTARYSTNSQFEQIFRCHKAASNNIIPNHLSRMSNQLSQLYTVERLLNEHTLFTLYAHFVKRDVVYEIVNKIYNDESRRAFMRLGLIAKGIHKENKEINICPVCIKKGY